MWACERECKRKLERLHNEEPHDLYSLPNILRAVKSRWVRWMAYVACMWEKRDVYRVSAEKS
jgi:hypothetical protein